MSIALATPPDVPLSAPGLFCMGGDSRCFTSCTSSSGGHRIVSRLPSGYGHPEPSTRSLGVVAGYIEGDYSLVSAPLGYI